MKEVYSFYWVTENQSHLCTLDERINTEYKKGSKLISVILTKQNYLDTKDVYRLFFEKEKPAMT